MTERPTLSLRGAREHNLADVDLDLPLGEWIAVTGPSGSGKTSLVFDTIVREGHHRFLGSMSARARHFFGRLGHADLDRLDGLPATVAVGQETIHASSRSTVGTLTGIVDLLRLLFAREGVSEHEASLRRSHFSFNHPDGACDACRGIGVEDFVDPDLLVADPSKSIRDGALRPTLKNGYTVYSQVTLDVMNDICHAHGFDVNTEWRALSDEQRAVVLYGTKRLKVPFGKHPIESRMKWEGITARPREEGYYRGLIPVIQETLTRNRNPNVLRFVRSVPCRACDGTRLGPVGRGARVGAFTLPALTSLSLREFRDRLGDIPPSPVFDSLRPALDGRLARLDQLGLAHLGLDRESATLSGGESQRIRLATQLTAGLGNLLVALDEPTLGLHPSGQDGMRAVFDELIDLGNTLLVVEHDPDMVRHASRIVRLGPGAGRDGGRVLENAPAEPDPLGPPPQPKAARRPGLATLTLRGATLHNLRNADLPIRTAALNVVIGPSGAGKTSLVFGTLLPALTGDPGGPYQSFDGAAIESVGAVDARPIGRTPRSTPATWSGLFDWIRKRFADTDRARELGFGPGHFSFNNKEGRCPDCDGLGFERVGLHLLEDLELPCARCRGDRYTDDVLQVRYRDQTIADVLHRTVDDAEDLFADDPKITAMCRAMRRLGIGYLPLGHPSNRLSRGEAQRVKLATLLGTQGARPTMLLLDEPDRGLHPSDIARLLGAIDALIDAGHTVVAISHHRHVWAAADHLIEVRDGVAAAIDTPDFKPSRRTPKPAHPVEAIELRGVRTNNLANIDVRIPHGRLTVICGVSGSGKSSLAFDTVASEAWHRFAESLPFQVRRFVQREARPDLDRARGLGPTLALRQGQARAGRRSTVATQTELGPMLRTLWSRAAMSGDEPCRLTAEHFSPDRALGACVDCEGIGAVPKCDPDQLVDDPTRPLFDGACHGSKPGKFFTEADGQYAAMLHAAGPDIDWTRPWCELPEQARSIALFGTGDVRIHATWQFSAKSREGSGAHEFDGTWDGLCALVEREAKRRANSKSAAQWRTTLVDTPCESCDGSGLQPAARAASLGGLTLPDLLAKPIEQVESTLRSLDLDARQRAVTHAFLSDLADRTADLCALGLGHLTLGRRSRTLSEGELQRVRIASTLHSGLTGITLVLDEPTAGLHPDDTARVLELLDRFRRNGNTILVVEHEPDVLRAADQLIELGPGAGSEGGHVVASGEPAAVLAGDTPTAIALRSTPRAPVGRRVDDRLTIRGARANNLRSIDVHVPIRGFVAVTGVSGSGKSSLVFDVLDASFECGAPRNCDAIELDGGLDRFTAVRSSRRTRLGQTVLTTLAVMAPLQRMFHSASDGALPRNAFSFGSPAGRCPTCHGTGSERVAMDFMADLDLPCPACGGRRYRDEVLAVRSGDRNIAEFLDTPADVLVESTPAGKLRDALLALQRTGLGYLSLGRRTDRLSGGEAQRLLLSVGLTTRDHPSLFLFDEPAAGLHEADVTRLLEVIDELRERGDLVIATEHRRSVIAAADHVVELGPGSGAEGGRLL